MAHAFRRALTLVLLAGAAPARGAGGTLTDQAVSLTYTASHWDGTPEAHLTGTEPYPLSDVVNESGWWYRVNGVDTREHPLPPPDSESWGGVETFLNWDNVDGKGFALREFVSVMDNDRPAGTYRSQLIHIRNLTAAPLSISFFHYLDADAGGSFMDDTGERLNARLLTFVEGASTGLYRGLDADHSMVRNAGLIGTWLNDATLTNLDDTGTPFGPGDWSGAFQWNVDIPPSQMSYDRIGVVVSSRIPVCSVKGDLHQIDNSADISFWRADTLRHMTWCMRRTTGGSCVWWTEATQPLATDDFTGDCAQDTVEREPQGRILFYELDEKNAHPPGIPLTGGPVLALNWTLAATADFNHDGRPDLLWRNTDSQRLVIWTMGQGGMPGTHKTGNLIPNPDHAVDGNWEVVAAADYDDDTNVDLLWYNPVSGRAVIWYMDAAVARVSGSFTTPPAAADANWRVVASADFGRGASASGGTPDLLWRNLTSGKLVVWHMNWGGVRASGTFTSPDSAGDLVWQVFGPR